MFDLRTNLGSRGLTALSAGMLLCTAACATAESRLQTAPVASQPSEQSKPAAFQPGVAIEWAAPAVRVSGQIASVSGGLEFLACFHTREHESVIRLDGSAMHIYMALGLIGVQPGHPPRWNEKTGRFDPAEGDLVDISVEWKAEETRRSMNAFEWLVDSKYGRVIAVRPWIFSGSTRDGDGGLVADASGRGIALVDFPENLLSLSRSHVSDDGDLWADARAEAIPPGGTKVEVVIRPARPRTHAATLDFRGDLYLDGRYIPPTDFADIVMLERRLAPTVVQEIRIDAALASDVRRVRTSLTALGVNPSAITFKKMRPSDSSEE